MSEDTIRVRATQDGHYPDKVHDGLDWKRRRPGDVFTLFAREIPTINVTTQQIERDPVTNQPIMKHLSAQDQFSHNWMERVDDYVPESITSAQEAIEKANAEKNGRVSRRMVS